MLGEVAALGLGIALSPFSVIPAILLLFTARPRPTALAFLAGWIVSIAVATCAFVLLAEVLDPGGDTPRWVAWLRLGAGVALVLYGVVTWRGRGASDEMPPWMRSIQDTTPAGAVRLAALLSLANPKVVLLAAAAGLDVGAADLSTAAVVGSLVAFTAVASSSVAAPVLAFVVAGERMLRPLGVAKDWLVRNNAAVMAVVLAAIGVVLVTNGAAGL